MHVLPRQMTPAAHLLTGCLVMEHALSNDTPEDRITPIYISVHEWNIESCYITWIIHWFSLGCVTCTLLDHGEA